MKLLYLKAEEVMSCVKKNNESMKVLQLKIGADKKRINNLMTGVYPLTDYEMEVLANILGTDIFKAM